jgi:hypothetical protein
MIHVVFRLLQVLAIAWNGGLEYVVLPWWIRRNSLRERRRR